jgi:hypothetical protein
MGMEQEEQVEEQQPDEGSAELEAQRVAAFSAAFDGKPTEPPPATDEELEQEQQQTAAPEAQPEPQSPKYRQITEDEYAELTARAKRVDELAEAQKRDRDALYGTIGGLQRSINQRQVISLPKEKLDALRNDIPEVAELFEAVAKATAAPTFDQDAILKSAEDRLKPALDQIEERAEQRAWIRIASKQMDLLHPGWKSDAEGTEFQTFAQAQGPEFVAKLAQASNAWDYPVISDALAKWKDAKKKAATSANTRRDRMAANVTPRGSSAPANPAKTREDAFLEGWNTSP